MAGIRYNIIRLEVEHSGQIVRFQHKIPAYLKQCTGFVARNVRGVQTDVAIAELGWLTTTFNNLKEEALVACVGAQPFGDPFQPYDFQTLHVALSPGELVTGVYVDSKTTTRYPYTVALYLRCTAAGMDNPSTPGGQPC
jgi:hypothetical protein